MTTDPWQHMLLSIQPAYFKWKDVMEQGPTIQPTLTFKDNGWELELVERWGTVDDAGNYVGSKELDERRKWTAEQLVIWDCRPTGAVTWWFTNKRNAEKFITMYYLVWAQ
jgi:hypothetical protein